MATEIFKSIPNYPNYEASNLGQVKSLNFKRTGKERMLKHGINGGGYPYLNLWKDGKRKTIKVHQLVIWAFKGIKPNGYKHHIDHLNGIKTDNRLDNLEVVSNRENISRGYKNKKTSSKYTGVSYNKGVKKYNSNIYINGKLYYLGLNEDDYILSLWYNKVLAYTKTHSVEETLLYIKSKAYKQLVS